MDKEETLCWSCRNFCNGCSWSKDLIPVENWVAKETEISFIVIECPEFKQFTRKTDKKELTSKLESGTL